MSDLIDRQAAIDVLARTAREKFNLSDEFNHYLAGLMDGELAIRQLPSAQTHSEGLYIDGRNDGYREGWKDGREALRREIWEDGRDRLD